MLKPATLASGASQNSDSPVGALENKSGIRTGGGSPEALVPAFASGFLPGGASPFGGAIADLPGTDAFNEFGGDCRRFDSEISAYLDGELDSDSQTEVETHLNNCPQCVAAYDALLATDLMIQREWRDDAPLPSASEMRFALDSIMDALPPVPVAPPVFAPRRIHAKARWMRFATGIAGVLALIGLLWSSYRFGFAQGRSSLSPQFAPRRQSSMDNLKSLLLRVATPKLLSANSGAIGSVFPSASSVPPKYRLQNPKWNGLPLLRNRESRMEFAA